MPDLKYTTREGDVLDRIVHDRYGRTAGVVEAVLEANPGLAARGPVLPRGIVITLPEVRESSRARKVRLWG